jgi:hypothetical protein
MDMQKEEVVEIKMAFGMSSVVDLFMSKLHAPIFLLLF